MTTLAQQRFDGINLRMRALTGGIYDNWIYNTGAVSEEGRKLTTKNVDRLAKKMAKRVKLTSLGGVNVATKWFL